MALQMGQQRGQQKWRFVAAAVVAQGVERRACLCTASAQEQRPSCTFTEGSPAMPVPLTLRASSRRGQARCSFAAACLLVP